MRYFLEVAYKGTNYSGFQLQENANTIQAEIQKAFKIILKKELELTGSSRTDAGVHAYQNYFHFDVESELSSQLLYNLNAILPTDISVKNLLNVKDDAHCRFDAISREYKYHIYQKKNPFLTDKAFYFPYTLDIEAMQKAAITVKEYSDFTSFSKRNTQVKSFVCDIKESKWVIQDECFIYNVKANRFLRGMVRALTSTMLNLGRGKIDLAAFRRIIETKDCTLANFSAPAHGLFLTEVSFPTNYFI
ncbi:MAG TPA: tRNA pseudouridine(38-40) synthase TruA [Chitinophagaceae bacterium]|jgi:tRNA pseudouridine38-40 synthase|nr:tRNA pseudouridine(38-40) synthase TruA [Chitinophagaceae bacterium]